MCAPKAPSSECTLSIGLHAVGWKCATHRQPLFIIISGASGIPALFSDLPLRVDKSETACAVCVKRAQRIDLLNIRASEIL